MPIRNSVKAVIVQDQKILTIVKQDENGESYYLLPGGGQEHGENFHETLARECREEIGAEVEIGDLLFIREYIGRNHEHAEFDYNVHQIEYMFVCHLIAGGEQIGIGSNPDDGQIGIEWLPMSSLLEYRFYPQTLRQYYLDYFNGVRHPVYLGDVN
ncbi:NUDIX domain-containing protein [Anaerobacillus alkaliphilus]|uniref:NUDIX domain-containing protein n=1 Tax=Anaerobacillus alkaliphilus TaxID=1548597 RepID=A0A4Q0VTB9_9BACI|nr:NUDIX domain-containing protein [Anaerobacillus alkaliphilus]RXJ00668.1 NUDIX domain-containing protein [Anaerobacillus alkaliphilus]